MTETIPLTPQTGKSGNSENGRSCLPLRLIDLILMIALAVGALMAFRLLLHPREVTTGTVIALLFTKMLVVYIIASLFGVRDTAGFHFFNFIRLLLVILGILTLVLATYYVLHGQQKGFYSFLYELLNWILGGWVILLFIKLANRVQYSVFHLFSYICATEIIPFLLIVKVLNE